MSSLYVVGGEQRGLRALTETSPSWEGFKRGLIVRVDTQTGECERVMEYVSPPDACALPSALGKNPSITFQAGTMENGKLYLCTQTEVLTYRLPDLRQIGYLSLPYFNDLHHVRPTPEGNLLVANAGLEMVMELTPQGAVLRTWSALGENPWARFSKEVDYRGLSTKPHRSHPNYLFYIGAEVWATRFQQGDALCLDDPTKWIPISSERIHDGVVYDGHVYFTTVNGNVVIANTRTLQVEEVVDLNSMHPDSTLLGWCRGIWIEAEKLWVGFSRIRPTHIRENVAWVMRGFKRVLPTHIACYDLRTRRCLLQVNLEAAGLNAIYSIFPAGVKLGQGC